MLSERFLGQLERLSLAVPGRVQGGAGGLRRAKDPGTSLEFSDFREYTLGDDLRRLDWTAYARTQRLYVREYMDEQETAVTLLLDASRSMEWKKARAQDLALTMGYLALVSGDRLQVMTAGEKVRMSPRFFGRRDLPRLLSFLQSTVMDGRAPLSENLRGVGYMPKGLTVVVSDPYGDGECDQCLGVLLSRGQQVMVCQVLAREEAQPELEGALALEDGESGSRVEQVMTGEVLDLYRKNLQVFLASSREACIRRGARYLLDTGEAAWESTILRRLFESRMIVSL